MTGVRRRLADKLMPWVAANATVWPSTHAVHGELVGQIQRYHAALEQIRAYYIGGWPDDPADQEAICRIAEGALDA